MDKKQEEIIYRLNSDIASPLKGGYTTIVLIDDLETILNMLKDKDKEIEKLKKHNKELLRKLRNRVKEVNKLQRKNYKAIVTKQGKTLEERAKQIKKQNKIIELMAEHICSSAIVDDTICAIKCDCETDINEDCTYEKMLKCTKQYFKGKATNDG